MAVELCRDSSSRGFGMGMGMGMGMNVSPRISFSHDLNQSDVTPTEPLTSSLLNYEEFDFDFCVSKRSCESSLADELFSNGVILPVEIKTRSIPKISTSASSSRSPVPSRTETEEEKQGKSFWKFKRSKSFNCGTLYKRGLLWPLPLLSRSKSTGSTAAHKGSVNSKDDDDHHHHHHEKFNGEVKQNYQKPPLKKGYGSSSSSSSSYKYRVGQVSPVLNVPTEKLLGLASIFSHGKDKGKKK